jgi:hypothetical protein
MIRKNLQRLKSAITTHSNSVREMCDDAAADVLEAKLTALVNKVTRQVETIQLNAQERDALYAGFCNADTAIFQQTLHDVQSVFRLRFYNEVLVQVVEEIYSMRKVALFLTRDHYNNYTVKVAALFETMGRVNAEVSLGLIREAINEFNKQKQELESAKKEHQAFGPTIEE